MRAPYLRGPSLFLSVLLLTSCSSVAVEESLVTVDDSAVGTEEASVEALDSSGPQISIEGAIAECATGEESGIVTLFVRNNGETLFFHNSNDVEFSIPKIETVLRNENGRGFADEAWHLTPEEGIAPAATGELYAYFGGLLIGFEGRFNQVEVMIDDVMVFEQAISLSQSDCG